MRSADLILQRHRVAKVFIGVGDAAAIETDELRIFDELFYFIHFLITYENAEMSFVIAFAYIVVHIEYPYSCY